jgi:AcrR family transcriptional regulator
VSKVAVDRRSLKKARTRTAIRSVAHRLFDEGGFEAVTIADVAAEADVAVQTVFNHFATKEELFFDGRADWVDAAAAAVRERPAGTAPLSALREHLMNSLTDYLARLRDPAYRALIGTIEASPALRAYERELHHESVDRLSDALTEALRDDASGGATTGGAEGAAIDPGIAAPLTASIWMSAIRALLIEQRNALADDAGAPGLRNAVTLLAGRVLEQFEWNLDLVPGTTSAAPSRTTVTGWPAEVRRAG